MSSQPPPKSQPKTEKHLGHLVSKYAEASGLGVRRVRQRVSAMAFLGALERVREEDSLARFLIKGGIGMRVALPRSGTSHTRSRRALPRLAR